MAASGVSAASKNIFHIQPPKTIFRVGIYSLLAISSALPKAIATKYFFEPDQFVYEKEADTFAWSHAKHELELKAIQDFHYALAIDSPGLFSGISSTKTALETYDAMSEEQIKGLQIGGILDRNHAKFDEIHPTPLARAHAIQEYIDTWDTKHPEDKQ